MRGVTGDQLDRAQARRLLFLGDYGVWGKALYGSQLRSERLAGGLAARYAVTYACMGHQPDAVDSSAWLERRGISTLLVGEPFDYARSARWGGPVDVVRSLLHRTVPLEIIERATADFVDRLRDLVGTTDVVWAHRSWMAEAARRAGFSSIVCDIDDFEGELARQASKTMRTKRRPLFRILDRRLSRYEHVVAERFAGVVVTKEEDRALVGNGQLTNCHVVPNGFDLPDCAPYPPDGSQELLFVGTLDYGPNIDAILWLYREIFPIVRAAHPAVVLRVVGRGPCPEVLQKLQLDSAVEIEVSPTSLVDAYAGAHVVVTPIRLGHGTRIKALEAIAYGRPLVSTSECLRGHPIVPGKHALVADSASEIAAACIRLLNDMALASELSHNGRRLAESLGGWDNTVSRAVRVLESI